MLNYCIILLDRKSVAFCHADNPYKEIELINSETLKEAVSWAMQHNLMIQFVHPDYELPAEYAEVINSIDHIDIKPEGNADLTVLDGIDELVKFQLQGKNLVVRLTLNELFANAENLAKVVMMSNSVSVVVKDIYNLDEEMAAQYNHFLSQYGNYLISLNKGKVVPNENLISLRLVLEKMKNCNAGYESITVGPNGNFYICPAFYYEDETDTVGNLTDGLQIPNSQLYKIDRAPICRNCDAWQCKRCVWLNRKMTMEVNTPSHEQCVAAHLERNASRDVLIKLKKDGKLIELTDIKEIDYLDPFDKIVY